MASLGQLTCWPPEQRPSLGREKVLLIHDAKKGEQHFIREVAQEQEAGGGLTQLRAGSLQLGPIAQGIDAIVGCPDRETRMHVLLQELVDGVHQTSHGFDSVENLEGGIDAWSLTIDPKVLRY